MTGAVRCLSRTLLQVSRSTTTKRKPGRSGRQWPITQCRSFSSVPWRLAEENASGSTTENATTDNNKSAGSMLTIEDLDPETKAEFDRSSPEDQQEMRDALRHLSESDPSEAFINAEIDEEIAQEVDAIEREEPMVFPEHKPNKNNAGFWADEEDDEFGQVFDEDDDFQADDITTPAHAQLDLHRDMREYQRRIAWDMPLLRKFAKGFTPPPLTSPLRFRYTTYMGEHHPSAHKVVVEVSPSDLPPSLLTVPQRNKLIKLAGVRYNPTTDVIKMSSEKFQSQAQNKRYLGDLINSLIAEARDPNKDSFEDVPFDFRHHREKKTVMFPEEWKLGKGRGERVRELVEGRERRRGRLLAEGKSGGGEEEAAVVDGDGIVRRYLEEVTVFQAQRQSVGMLGAAAARQGGQAGRTGGAARQVVR